MLKYVILLQFSLLLLKVVDCNEFKTFDELYADGLEAYWNENWKGCISYLEKAIQNYRYIQDGVFNCSSQCKISITQEVPVIFSYKYIVEKAICIESCEKAKFGDARSITRISEEAKHPFKNRDIYKYLQFAYFRDGRYSDSVTATHTFSLYNPEDKMMKANMEYYHNNKNTTPEMFIDLEENLFHVLFDQGVDAFNNENYAASVSKFQLALQLFYHAEAKCRVLCEGEFNVGSEYPDISPTFYDQIIDHYRSVLECSISCPTELARRSKLITLPNYLPKHYYYMLYAYKKLGRLNDSAISCKAYLLFHPNNQEVISNLRVLAPHTTIKPAEEAVKFKDHFDLQKKLLQYIYQNFGISDYNQSILHPYQAEDLPKIMQSNNFFQANIAHTEKTLNGDKKEDLHSESPSRKYKSDKQKKEDIITSKDQHNIRMESLQKKQQAEDQLNDVDISFLSSTPIGRRTTNSNHMVVITDALPQPPIPEGPILFESTMLLANSTQMLGRLRFALDGLSSSKECQQLIDLELAAGLSGDGYRGLSSPHTKHERFEGLTVHRAAELAEGGKLPLGAAQLYYDLSERVRMQVKAYFKLEEELYFDYTHLVCRTALKGINTDRADMSHPVHGDNCNLHEDGTCVKASPAYTWRDYSAILYLNNEFDGGEFVMTDSTARRVKLEVKPKCGRMVSFCAGKECLHGVKPITRGRRCAMALWFTKDVLHNERLRKLAKKILDNLGGKDEL